MYEGSEEEEERRVVLEEVFDLRVWVLIVLSEDLAERRHHSGEEGADSYTVGRTGSRRRSVSFSQVR